MRRILITLLMLAVSIGVNSGRAAAEEGKKGINWRGWSNHIFKEAQKDKRLVILDLEAVWCHWCHVMEEKTYSRPEIIRLIGDSFIAVRADQDAYPDLSARYRDYGWPATVLFNPEGQEIQIMSGFVEPDEMEKALEKAVSDPRPNKKNVVVGDVPVLTSLPGDVKNELELRHERAIDTQKGGLTTSHRYLDPGSVEYAIVQAASGNEKNRAWSNLTLKQNEKLIDPAWGGVYQYSTGRDWVSPHFEKIMQAQANNIILYSLAYQLSGQQEFLTDAKNIAKYVNSFLRSPEGAYYVSQDADLKKGEHSAEYFNLDDAGRRALGMPRIDTNLYARESGWAIEAMATLYAASREQDYLDKAVTAAKWAIAQRQLPEGGFKHGEKSDGGPYLGDSLAMSRGLVALYSVTGDRQWLAAATHAMDFIASNFREPKGVGYFSFAEKAGGALEPIRRLEENVTVARTANLLYRYTGQDKYLTIAREALTFAGQKEIALDSISEPSVLLADFEISNEPAHITLVGKKSDPGAPALWNEMLAAPVSYVRREWWDRTEGAMPNPDVGYPNLPRPAGFVCANKRCSLPMFSVTELRERLATLATTAPETKDSKDDANS